MLLLAILSAPMCALIALTSVGLAAFVVAMELTHGYIEPCPEDDPEGEEPQTMRVLLWLVILTLMLFAGCVVPGVGGPDGITDRFEHHHR